MLGLGVFGFIGTWIIGAFTLGRAVEQMKAALKLEIEKERDGIVVRIEAMESRFEDQQKDQDHNFGEVGAAMRQYIADVEKKLREVEIYGRDNYVKIPDFEKAMDRLSGDLKSFAAEIKKDFKDSINDLKAGFAGRP
jgi:hypothetical protein